MTKKRILFLASIILIPLTVIYISLQKNSKQQSIQPIKLSELQIKSDFYLTGVIEPKNVIDYKMDKNKGVISERKVNVGDTVKKGQVLYVYTNPDGDMAIQEAELSVKNAEKIVEQKKKESELKVQQYQSLLLNQQELDKRITDSKNEEEKNELTKTKGELTASITQAEIDNSSAESELENANLEVEKANLELTKIQKTQGNHEVVSDISGVVMDIDNSQLNLTVTDKAPEKPFLSIVDTSIFFLRGKVDEYRKNDLKVDQSVQVIDRNNSSKTWTGKITQIGNVTAGGTVDEEQGGNPNLSQFAFEITLDSTETPPAIGLHCFAELDKGNAEESLSIPKEYVVEEKNQVFIWTVKNKKLAKKVIEVAEDKTDSSRYTIKNNLTEKTELVYPTSSLSVGMDVTLDD